MCSGLHANFPIFLLVFKGTWIFWTNFRKILQY